MSGERVERRLAAILAVDVAGYSRLLGADEEGTHAAMLAVRRELGDPKIREHRGRIVKTTGDGLLVEFASVVDIAEREGHAWRLFRFGRQWGRCEAVIGYEKLHKTSCRRNPSRPPLDRPQLGGAKHHLTRKRENQTAAK